MADLALNIAIRAMDQSATSVMRNVGGSIGGLGGALGLIVPVATAAAAAMVAFGVASVDSARDFQQTMLQTQALAGVTEEGAKMATDAMMKLAPAIGQTPQQLAKAFYYIASTGADAADSMKLLEISAKAAAVGNTETEITANALTATLNAFGLSADESAKYMDMMVASVSMGKTEFEDYARVIGIVAVNAKQSGVSFAEATSAFSALTNVMATSKQSKDALDALLQTSSRFSLLAARASDMGLAFDESAYKSMNLKERLQYLMQITGGNTEQLAKLLGRQNAVAAATALSANNFAMYDKALQAVSNSHGALDASFAKTQQGLNASLDRLNAAWEVLKVQVGTGLLPIITNIVNAVTPLITAFTNWASNTNNVNASMGPMMVQLRLVGDFLMSTFKPVWDQLVTTFTSDVLPAWRDLQKELQPIMPELRLVASIVGGLLVLNLMLLVKALSLCWQVSVIVFGGIIKTISGFVQIASGYMALFVDLVTGKWNKLDSDVKIISGGWGRVWSAAWETVKRIFDAGYNYIKGIIDGIKRLMGGISTQAAALPGHASGIVNSPTTHMAWVGEHGPELMMIPAGASVYNQSQMPKAFAGGGSSSPPLQGGNTVNISINVDGRSARSDADLIDQLMEKLNRELMRSGLILPTTKGL